MQWEGGLDGIVKCKHMTSYFGREALGHKKDKGRKTETTINQTPTSNAL